MAGRWAGRWTGVGSVAEGAALTIRREYKRREFPKVLGMSAEMDFRRAWCRHCTFSKGLVVAAVVAPGVPEVGASRT